LASHQHHRHHLNPQAGQDLRHRQVRLRHVFNSQVSSLKVPIIKVIFPFVLIGSIGACND
jgi:hypothetical protein